MHWLILCTATTFLAATAHAAPEAAVTVNVPARYRVINGEGDVPIGLFGVHATPLTEARREAWGVEAVRVIHQQPTGTPTVIDGVPLVLECFYDRYQPAWVLADPAWRDRLTQLGRRYARSVRDAEEAHPVEFWNEPYLNWAVKPGVNYDGRFYDSARAREGAAVYLPGEDEPVPHLVWRRGLRPVEVGSEAVDYLAWDRGPRDPKPGQQFAFRGRQFRFEPAWLVKDLTQRSFWSGQHNLSLYLAMLRPFAQAIKQENPDVVIVAGWGFHLYQDGWSAWRELHRPTIDAAIDVIDGYNEHHYGGDTRRVAVSYEMAYGYAQAKHGKRLRFYNTEAGGFMDPERPDTTHPRPKGNDLDAARGAMTYMLRDLLYLLDRCPDKAASRFTHEAHHTAGDGVAFELLRPLRGQLLATTTSDDQLWSAASIRDDQLAVVLFNDSDQDQQIVVRLDAFTAGGSAQATVATPAVRDGTLALRERPITIRDGNCSVPVRARSAARLLLTIDPDLAQERESWVQFGSADVLQHLEPGASAQVRIDVPTDTVAAAAAARLRLVVEGPLPADATVMLNGRELPGFAGSMIMDRPVPTQLIRPDNRVVVQARDQSVHVVAASLYLATVPETPQ